MRPAPLNTAGTRARNSNAAVTQRAKSAACERLHDDAFVRSKECALKNDSSGPAAGRDVGDAMALLHRRAWGNLGGAIPVKREIREISLKLGGRQNLPRFIFRGIFLSHLIPFQIGIPKRVYHANKRIG